MPLSVKLKLKSESIASGRDGLLKHQEETVDALKRHPIVMNCAMTGAGKTKAAHLGIQTQAFNWPVLFVAPTNALVSQHLADAKEFVAKNGLPHKVAGVDGAVLSLLQKSSPSLHRPSAALHQLIYNPRAFGDELGIDDKAGPLWLITNPDQIWLSIVRGRDIDTRNLLKDFINHFRFVVVDEFHYYTAEQLVLFFLCVAFWRHFGQFDDGLKMLLLTATPDELVENFFRRMGFDPCIIGKDDNDEVASIPVLSPVDLTMTTGSIADFSDYVIEQYNDGKDGVVIADSIFEINKAYKDYEKAGISVGRITGPIRNRKRKSESQKRLILATPTVDLGFNFIKLYPKDRQEIDFLLSTVRNISAFWQRLGRAGRVLGRKETQIPTQAVMLLPDSDCYKQLAEFEGQEITRTKLKKLLNLRDQRLKGSALTREGLYTATRQLIQIRAMLPDADKSMVEQIFNTLKACFDPHDITPDWPSYSKQHWLSNQFQQLENENRPLTSFHINQWLKADMNNEKSYEPMGVLLGAWAKNHFFRKGQLNQYIEYLKKNDRMAVIRPLLLKKKSAKKEIINYFKEQVLRLDYLFNFRGSGTKERVWVYDPQNLHSAHLISKIDLITLLSKYHFKGSFSRSAAEQTWKISLPKGDMFFEITEFQEYPYRPVFKYQDELPLRVLDSENDENKDAELLPCYWQTVALHDLSLEFENSKIGLLSVPAEIKHKLTGLSELFFITPIENRFVLNKWLKEYDVQAGTLMTRTEIGTFKPHSVIPGKDAILISEELYFRKQNELC